LLASLTYTWRRFCKSNLHELYETLSLLYLATSYRNGQKGARLVKRAERTKLLIDVGREEAFNMAQIIEARYDVTEVQAAREGLVMVKMRESAQQSLFYIGEVLVTETKVKVGDAFGLGLVKEHDPQLSRALAIIDAAYNGQLQETVHWAQTFELLTKRMQQQQHETKRSIERTKVQFNTMSI